MAGLRDHTEFDVWKICDELRMRVRSIVDRPVFRRYPKLREQLSEAAESPCPNIAEGFSRYLPRDFARFVRVAKGSLTEVIVHMGRALDRRLVLEEETREICRLAKRGRGAATRLILYLENADAPGSPRRRNSRQRQRREGGT
jgi:four helix bundle protein